MHKLRTFSLIVLSGLSAAIAGGERRMVGEFSSGSLTGWEPKSFEGETDYSLTQVDGRTALRAQCDGSASGLVLQQEIDLTQTPMLHWSWRVDEVYPGLDERTKAGDDYPARIYVVHDGGWLKWRSRAINYVWSNSQPVGETWPNAFASQAMMVAVRSGAPEQRGEWHSVSRNVRKDFERIFGMELDNIDAVAIMTDCDNSGLKGNAYYGDIYFSDVMR